MFSAILRNKLSYHVSTAYEIRELTKNKSGYLEHDDELHSA